MAVMTASASKSYRVEPRSVIAGRQRWDIAVLLGRPRVAEFLETRLRERSGVGVVRANPVTGRLLVFHNAELSGDEVGQLVRQAAAQAAARHPSPRSGGRRGLRFLRRRRRYDGRIGAQAR